MTVKFYKLSTIIKVLYELGLILMRLMHNLASLNIYYQQTKANKAESVAMRRISSGLKISKATDGPNKLAQSESMNMQIRGMQVAQRNCQDGASMLQAAEGGLDNVTSALQRMRQLSISAGSATDDNDKAIIQGEIKQLGSSINEIINGTDFNGVKVLQDTSVTDNSNPGGINFLVGSNAYDTLKIPTYNVNTSLLGNMTDPLTPKSIDSIDVTQTGGIDQALDIIDHAITTVTGIRSKYGAIENRLTSTYDTNGNLSDSTQRAQSSITDADIALEMANYAKADVLSQAGDALMAQTNRMPQDTLRILENIR